MVNDYVQSSLTCKTDEVKTLLNPAPAQREKEWGACARPSPGCCCRGAAPGVDRTPRGFLVRAVTATRRHRTRGSTNSPAQRGQTRGPRRHVRARGQIRPPRPQLPPPAGSSSSAPHFRLTAIDPAAAGRAQTQPRRAGRHATGCCGQSPPPALPRPWAAPAARSPAPALTARAAGRTRSAMLCVTPTTERAPSGNCRAEPRSGGNGRSRPAAHGEWRKVPSAAGPAAAPRVPASGGCCAVPALRSGPRVVFRAWWIDL